MGKLTLLTTLHWQCRSSTSSCSNRGSSAYSWVLLSRSLCIRLALRLSRWLCGIWIGGRGVGLLLVAASQDGFGLCFEQGECVWCCGCSMLASM